MIAEQIETSTKYYQFTSLLEHMLDCFHTIVSDETNPYHPPLGWLTRKQPKPADDELFLDLMDECSRSSSSSSGSDNVNNNLQQLSSSVRSRLERYSREQRSEIVSRTRDGCSPLFVACKNGLTGVARYLLDSCNANLEQMGRFEALEDHHIHSVSPIWVASVCGHLETVELLIQRGANVNCLSDTGSTPLRSVCFLCHDDDGPGSESEYDQQNNHNYQANDMLGLAEDDNDDDDQFEVISRFDSDPYVKIVKLLVANGADVGRANYKGATCLINSLHNYTLSEYILDLGADIDAADYQSKTALHYAIQQGRLQQVRLLISRGANPLLRSSPGDDDALQLACISGHVDIFEYLIKDNERRHYYPPERLIDAYKLLGSSILEIHYDLARVRQLWNYSLVIKRQQQQQTSSSQQTLDINDKQPENGQSRHAMLTPKYDRPARQQQQQQQHRQRRRQQVERVDSATQWSENIDEKDGQCDTRRRRLIAYGDMEEFQDELELQALSADDFRIQSLLISERVLGSTHRETIQRLLYRGTFYMNSLQPNRCIDLWIYALKLRLKSDSIFHFESIFAAQAISKLFLDLFSQQQQVVRFADVHDVLSLLLSKLADCKQHLALKPASCLHEDIFDLLLSIVVSLLMALKCIASSGHQQAQVQALVAHLARSKPRTCNGSSLLHVCLTPSIFDCEPLRRSTCHQLDTSGTPQAPPTIVGLIGDLIDAGLDPDDTNADGLSVLQALCLSGSIRSPHRAQVIRMLVQRGAHVDRRTAAPEQDELIKQALREAKVDPFAYVSLACLAARQVARHKSHLLGDGNDDNRRTLAKHLRESIEIH